MSDVTAATETFLDEYVWCIVFDHLVKYNFAALMLTNKHLNECFRRYLVDLSNRWGYGASKLRPHQIMMLKWINLFVSRPRNFDIALQAGMSSGKTIVGLTSCFMSLDRCDTYCLYITSANAFNELQHECKKHFSAELKSGKLLVCKSGLKSYKLIQSTLVPTSVEHEVKDMDPTKLKGTVIISSINSRITQSLVLYAHYIVMDEFHKNSGAIRATMKAGARILAMSASKPKLNLKFDDRYIVLESGGKLPTLEFKMVFNSLKGREDYIPTYKLVSAYPDRHKLYICTDGYAIKCVVSEAFDAGCEENYYDYHIKTISKRQEFGFQGGVLCTDIKSISEGQNMNECSIMFLEAPSCTTIKTLWQCVGRVWRTSNQHKTISVVFILRFPDVVSYARCKLLMLRSTLETTIPGHYLDDVQAFDKALNKLTPADAIDLLTEPSKFHTRLNNFLELNKIDHVIAD